jgi:hypothetical protein
MRRVGALLPTSFEPAHRAAALEQLVQQQFFTTAGEEAVAKCAAHGKVKARIRQREPKQVFPVDTGAHRLGRLALGEILAKLHHGDERQAPGREAGLTLQREAGGKVVVLEDRPEGIPQEQVRMALRKGGTGYTSSFFRYRLQGVRA